MSVSNANKRKSKHPFGTKQSHFLGGAKSPHYFRGSPILILLGERFWDIKDVANDLSFVKVLFFPIQVLNVSFWKGLFLGNDFEVLNQSPKRFQTKNSPKIALSKSLFFFFLVRESNTIEVFLRLIILRSREKIF